MSSPIITSLLDTDIYKYTMAQFVLFGRFGGINFQEVEVEYAFFNRGYTRFPPGFADALRKQINT